MERFEFTRLQMGVQSRIVLYAPASDQQAANDAAAAAFATIARLDQIMSDYRPDSELMQLCAHATKKPMPLSDDLFAILQSAQSLAESTSGEFDVTVGPLTRLWREARRIQALPSQSDIDAARSLVGWRNLVIDELGHTASLKVAKMSLDLGGIAKGYAADRAVQTLRERGFNRCLIALAGDIAVADPPPQAEGWRIAIAPREVDHDVHDPSVPHVLLANACISTSGDAEQHIEVNRVRYSHIIDPRTGYGITNQINVTVIAQRGEIADGLASAVSVMGDSGLGLATHFNAAIILDRVRTTQLQRSISDPNGLIRWCK